MALDTIVIDNTVLNFFLKLSSVNLSSVLRSVITGRILVPSEIVREMQSLSEGNPSFVLPVQKLQYQIVKSNFLMHCHSYDSVVLEFAQKNIDKGEAEAVAQCIKRKVPYFITDDLKCLSFIKHHYNDIQIGSTFLLIALADIHGLILNYNNVFVEYHRILNYHKMGVSKIKVHQERIKNEYSHAAKLLGIQLNEKTLNLKTNFKLLAEIDD
jgi:predicted nucleic acid-binding protein